MEDIEKKILNRQKDHVLLNLKLNDINMELENAEYKMSLIDTKLYTLNVKLETLEQNNLGLEKMI